MGSAPVMTSGFAAPMTSYVQQPTYISQPATTIVRSQPVVQETIIEDLVIDVNIERPTVSGGIDALGLKPTQLEPIQPTFVTPVNETIVQAPQPVTYVTQMAAPLTNTLNRRHS